MNKTFEYKDITIDYVEQIAITQQAVECTIDTAAKGGISKLLSVCADTVVTVAECTEESVKFNGNINYKVIILNAESQLVGYDYVCDFTATAKADDIDEYSNITAKGCVLDIDTRVTGDTIRLQTVVDITVYGEKSESEKALVGVPDDTLANYSDIGLQSTIAHIDQVFNIEEEYSTGVNVGNILLFDTDVINCSTTMQEGLLTVSGEIVASVVYESGGGITTKNFNIPYQEDIVANVTAYNRAEITTTVDSSRIVLAGIEDDNIIRLEITLKAQGAVYESSELTVIDDVYCLSNCMEVDRETLKYHNFLGESCFKEKIAGSAELGENVTAIRKVLSSCLSRNCVTSATAHDGRINVEGILACAVIYEDAEMAIDSMQVELPYMLEFVTDKVKHGDIVSVNSVAEILSAKIKRDREIEVTALVSIQAIIRREVAIDIITEVELGECKATERKAVTIYATKQGETLWNIAKEIGADQQALVEQNPWLKEGEAHGEKVVFYRQLNS